MSKTIEIIISPTGETKIQTKGFSGATCQNASRAIEQALGDKISEEKTTEFYRAGNGTTDQNLQA